MKQLVAILFALCTLIPIGFFGTPFSTAQAKEELPIEAPKNQETPKNQCKICVYNQECKDQPCLAIAEDIKKVDHCLDCVVIVMERSAFVCVRTKGVTSKSKCDAIKSQINEVVRNHCPTIENIFITTSVKPYAVLRNCKEPHSITLQQLLTLFAGKRPTINIEPIG